MNYRNVIGMSMACFCISALWGTKGRSSMRRVLGHVRPSSADRTSSSSSERNPAEALARILNNLGISTSPSSTHSMPVVARPSSEQYSAPQTSRSLPPVRMQYTAEELHALGGHIKYNVTLRQELAAKNVLRPLPTKPT